MSSFNYTQPNGATRQVSGYHASTQSEDDVNTWVPSGNLSHTPLRVDLRQFMSSIEQQGSTNSCVANATAGAYEYLVKRHLGADGYDVSRLFIYYNARAMDPEGVTPVTEDVGSFTKCAIAGLKTYGAPSETSWPFNEDLVAEQPSDEVYAEAEQFCIEDAFKLETDLNVWRTALAEGHPIIFGCNLFTSFEQGRRGKVPMPNPNEAAAASHGAHAMLCVGYSDHDQVFIVRNSWGETWGDRGYCYMPYRYLMNPEYNLNDSWIIERVDVLPPDEATWADDDDTILQSVSGILADMDEEQYDNLVAYMGAIPLEVRLSLIFLHAAIADGELGEEEVQAIAAHLTPVLEQLGSYQDAYTVLQNTQTNFMRDENLLWETVDIFPQVFTQEVLATIAGQLQQIVASDEVHEAEQAFVNTIVERWQVVGDGGDAAVEEGAGEEVAYEEAGTDQYTEGYGEDGTGGEAEYSEDANTGYVDEEGYTHEGEQDYRY